MYVVVVPRGYHTAAYPTSMVKLAVFLHSYGSIDLSLGIPIDTKYPNVLYTLYGLIICPKDYLCLEVSKDPFSRSAGDS